jgi:hypothetical protein
MEGKGEAIQAGVRIGGAAVGEWLSTVLGPEAGPAVAETISEAGVAAVEFLGNRKSERVSRTLTEISDEAAAQSVENRKCAVVANVYASIAFDRQSRLPTPSSISSESGLGSWRQLVALQFLQAGGRARERERIVAAGQEGNIDMAPALSAEFSELSLILELIGTGIPGGRISNPSTTFGGVSSPPNPLQQ